MLKPAVLNNEVTEWLVYDKFDLAPLTAAKLQFSSAVTLGCVCQSGEAVARIICQAYDSFLTQLLRTLSVSGG